METKAEGKVCYTVEQSRSGQWEVTEPGFDRPIVSFSDRDDALEYARRLTEVRASPAYARIRSAGYRVS